MSGRSGSDAEAPSGPATAPGRRLLDGDAIARRIVELGASIRAAYGNEPVTIVLVLNGAMVFASDLIRQLDMPLEVETVRARSYRGTATAAGELDLETEHLPDLADRHVLLVDDILDTGRTLARLREVIAGAGPRSLRVAVFLDKPSRRLVDVQADFTGFEIPDLFVIGYGLDHDGRWRNLPGVHVLGEEGDDLSPPRPRSDGEG